jgi:hypothetical protein
MIHTCGYTDPSSLAGWPKMNHLPKAIAFWISGLIAIGLSLTFVSVNYRTVSIFRSHDSSFTSTPTLIRSAKTA